VGPRAELRLVIQNKICNARLYMSPTTATVASSPKLLDRVRWHLRVKYAVQELLGHKDVSTTMIYTHVWNKPGLAVRSPWTRNRRRADGIVSRIRWKIIHLILVRRMKPVIIAFLLLGGGFMDAASPPLKATVQQLLSEPQKFIGKRVDVTGYCHTSNDEVSLAVSKQADEKAHSCENTIWLEPDIWDPRYQPQRPTHIAKSDDIDFRNVRVIGTFHYEPHPILDKTVPYEHRYRGHGSFRMWARAIKDITYFQPVR